MVERTGFSRFRKKFAEQIVVFLGQIVFAVDNPNHSTRREQPEDFLMETFHVHSGLSQDVRGEHEILASVRERRHVFRIRGKPSDGREFFRRKFLPKTRVGIYPVVSGNVRLDESAEFRLHLRLRHEAVFRIAYELADFFQVLQKPGRQIPVEKYGIGNGSSVRAETYGKRRESRKPSSDVEHVLPPERAEFVGFGFDSGIFEKLFRRGQRSYADGREYLFPPFFHVPFDLPIFESRLARADEAFGNPCGKMGKVF